LSVAHVLFGDITTISGRHLRCQPCRHGGRQRAGHGSSKPHRLGDLVAVQVERRVRNSSVQQRWTLSRGTWSHVQSGLHSDQYLDADVNTVANNGGKVQLWERNSDPQQYWYYAG
jgi:hypothetical protein